MITERARQNILRETVGCLVCGHESIETVELHHVRCAATSGVGLKPPNEFLVPLCSKHHREGHQIGWKTWQEKYEIDLAAEVAILAKIDRDMP